MLSSAQAATYYFSSSQGDDNRSATQAQSQSTPWKSITKLNGMLASFQAGDVIMFKRGDVFEGAIVFPTSTKNLVRPLQFGAYGTGTIPVISSLTTLSGWTAVTNKPGVFEATLPTVLTKLNMVTINGVPYAVGRYPNPNSTNDNNNKGYLTIDSYSLNGNGYDYQITDAALSAITSSWVGADIVIRKQRWIINRHPITAHSGTTLTYQPTNEYGLKSAGWGYFIQNHPSTLDSFGEWYVNKANGKLQVYFGSNGPTGYTVKASQHETGVNFNMNDNITFDNLSFQGANSKAFAVDSAAYISLNGCQILYSGADAINGGAASHFKLENSTINYTLNTAIIIGGDGKPDSPNAIIRNNAIKNTGIFAGMGQNSNYTYQAMMAIGNNILIEGNKVDSTGATGLSFRGSNAICQNNVVNTFAFVKDDAGGIHINRLTANANAKILDNIVLNGIGSPEGAPVSAGSGLRDLYLSMGIYLDDFTTSVEVARNTASQCGEGLYVHNATDSDIHHNTLYDNRDHQVHMKHDEVAKKPDGTFYPIRTISFSENILVSTASKQNLLTLSTRADDNDIKQFGTFTNNHFALTKEYHTYAVTTVTNNTPAQNTTKLEKKYTLDAWKTFSGFETGSQENTPTADYTINSQIGNNRFSNSTFDSNIDAIVQYAPAGTYMQASWDGTNKLGPGTGGSLKVAFTQSSSSSAAATVYMTIGALEANKNYIVRFSTIGSVANQVRKVTLTDNQTPYPTLATKSYRSTTSRKDFEFLIKPSASVASGRLRFEFINQQGGIWLDNIEVYEADATIDPEHVRFEYNPTTASQSLWLHPYQYKNGKDIVFENSFDLAAFASQVFIKQPYTAPTPPQPCTASGSILQEYWANVTGKTVASIPLTTTPTSTNQLTALEYVPNPTGSYGQDNYGQRIRGYICAPTTGSYTFYLAADDDSELWLSTDENPTNKIKLLSLTNWTNPRQWNKYPTQQTSTTINLIAGKRYYVEVLHKEDAYNDHVAVGWTTPTNSTIAVIPGSVLSPFVAQPCTASGSILQEYWANVTGKTVASIPLTTTPTSTNQLTALEYVPNPPTGSYGQDNYGQRIRGYICAPTTGNYTFYLAADDDSELWLSTDENPTNKSLLLSLANWTNPRQWNKYPTQQTSTTINLIAGKRYYVEVLHKEDAYNDHVAVGWTTPTNSTIAVIPGSVLSPFAAPTSRLAAEARQELPLAVYPNPFDDKLTLEFKQAQSGPVTIKVVDLLGKVYYLDSRKVAEGDTQIMLNLSARSLVPGLYFLHIEDGSNKPKTIKMIKR